MDAPTADVPPKVCRKLGTRGASRTWLNMTEALRSRTKAWAASSQTKETPGKTRKAHQVAALSRPMSTPDYRAATHWMRSAVARKGRRQLSDMVRACLACGLQLPFPGVPFDLATDSVEFGYRVGRERADAAIFHVDGSLTLVEFRHGSDGINVVLEGIGRVTMYALLTAAMSSARPRTIRRAILWSALEDIHLDVLVELRCERAGVVPMPFGPMDQIMAAARAVVDSVDSTGEAPHA